MTHAAITGWGKCLPPAVLTNDDLATFLDTGDDWIFSRTGMRERRVSHVPLGALAHVAAARALACAGLEPRALDLIVAGSTLGDELAPNVASGVQKRLGASGAGAMDLNTACTSFLYGLSAATALIRTGAIRTALVIGAEVPTPFLDWEDRNTAVLFGDGCGAVVLEGTSREEGILAERLGCYGEVREILDIRGVGARYANLGLPYGFTRWTFDGQEIFKRAVLGMAGAGVEALARCGKVVADVDLVVPHQANRRIIDAVGKRLGVAPEKVFVNVHRYANMSAATVPVALVEALEEGRVAPGALLLLPAFGAGLTWCAHVVRWGERVSPLGASDVALPPCDRTGLELVQELRERRARYAAAARPFIEAAGPLLSGRER
ncbi:MAG TPA: beta-ketoacyl-ACP synthase 3 [Anaeromyxobacteraceae bacterium]|nr:beta-ketoacyl-ACP synthase 3 [Anaeromyxobacteraceae bacterium]